MSAIRVPLMRLSKALEPNKLLPRGVICVFVFFAPPPAQRGRTNRGEKRETAVSKRNINSSFGRLLVCQGVWSENVREGYTGKMQEEGRRGDGATADGGKAEERAREEHTEKNKETCRQRETQIDIIQTQRGR